jgi:predicted RNase H-like HicB family nuclease
MRQFVFPAIFIREESGVYTAIIPDLDLVTDGDTIEEAFLFIKDYLRVFCSYAIKLEEDILIPSKFENVAENNKNNIVMLIDAIV